MTFDEYQKTAVSTLQYKGEVPLLCYLALGLAGEGGEAIEKIKKLYRDKDGQVTDEFTTNISKELGDVLWYMANICNTLEIPLSKIAELNIEKILSRVDRGIVRGDGDNR